MINKIKKASYIGFIFSALIFGLSACRKDLSRSYQDNVPSLIPLPQSLQWTKDRFPLNKCEVILIQDTTLRSEAKRWLAQLGMDIPIKYKLNKKSKYYIQLKYDKIAVPYGSDEAYHLRVSNKDIILRI